MDTGFIYPGSPQASHRARGGQFRPVSPDRYVPASLKRMREQVAEAIAHEIKTRGIKAADIIGYLPSIRKSDVDKFLEGFGDTIAERKLFQIGEAIGLRFDVEIKGTSK
jgi:predicted XRE-type DNA-binding protein